MEIRYESNILYPVIIYYSSENTSILCLLSKCQTAIEKFTFYTNSLVQNTVWNFVCCLVKTANLMYQIICIEHCGRC